MVKSKKNKNNKAIFKSRKMRGGAFTTYIGTQDTVSNMLTRSSKDATKFAQSMSDNEFIKTSVVSPVYGSNQGASSYSDTLQALESIRRSNIGDLQTIIGAINKINQSGSKLSIYSLIRKFHSELVKTRYQKIKQHQNKINDYKGRAFYPDKNKTELEIELDKKIEKLRTFILDHIATLVKTENDKAETATKTVLQDSSTRNLSQKYL